VSSVRGAGMYRGVSLRTARVQRTKGMPPQVASIPFKGDLQARTWASVRLERGATAAVDLADAQPQFAGHRLDQGPFHQPLQAVELVEVFGQLVIRHAAAILGLVLRHEWAFPNSQGTC
jgi:hypothetical protein